MLDLCLDEDFGFCTPEEVLHYTDKDRLYKPVLPSYQWVQLLDQISDCVLKSQGTYRIAIVAHSGSAFWLAKHLQYDRPVVELGICCTNIYNAMMIRNIAELPRVVCCVDEHQLSAFDLFVVDTDCVVLLCWGKSFLTWFNQMQASQQHKAKTIIAYDPSRSLKNRKEGKYFMNSKIWVSRGR